MISIRHGILEIDNHPSTKKSAIIFNDSIIITSATILYETFRKYEALTNDSNKNEVVQFLKNFTAVDAHRDPFQFLNEIKFEITFDRRDFGAKSKFLSKYRAKLLYVFNCADISRSTTTIFENLDPCLNCDNIQAYNKSLHQLLISSFIILRITDSENNVSTNIKNFKNFVKNMKIYIKFLNPVNKLDDVLSISTPFGVESFYKTLNVGKISNIFGKDSCLFIISNTLVFNCEGAGVFNSKLRLVGIIISSTLQNQSENANLTLVASFKSLFKEFLKQINETFHENWISKYTYTSSLTWENSVVLISCGKSWGTGTFITVRGKKFILTCSHVVKNSPNKIHCHYNEGDFETTVIWMNPTLGNPYDVAILNVPENLPSNVFVKLSNARPRLMQTIYNVGFPLISRLGKEVFKPSVYEGKIVKNSPGMIISDGSVQAGQSGGPMFDENGCVLGICVSNIRGQAGNAVFPNINMAIPVWNIKSTLEAYATTNAIQELNKLIAGPEIKRIWALEGPLIESKL